LEVFYDDKVNNADKNAKELIKDHKKYAEALGINVNLVQSGVELPEITTLEKEIADESGEVSMLT